MGRSVAFVGCAIFLTIRTRAPGGHSWRENFLLKLPHDPCGRPALRFSRNAVTPPMMMRTEPITTHRSGLSPNTMIPVMIAKTRRVYLKGVTAPTFLVRIAIVSDV